MILIILVEYIIRPLLPQIGEPKNIDKDIYDEITNDRKLAFDILLVQEFFSYVIRNFFILEKETSRIETEIIKNIQTEPSSNRNFILDSNYCINLHIMNLLTVCRSYLELFDYQGKNKKRELFLGKNKIRESLEEIRNKYHNQNIIYDFFWDLRNFAQHNGRPINDIPTQYDSTGGTIGFIVNVEVMFNCSEKCSRLKAYMEKDLQYNPYNPRKLNIRPLVEKYILLLENINKKFNAKLEQKLKEKKLNLSQKISFYCQDNSTNSCFEIFSRKEDTQTLQERFDVSIELIDDWEKTIKRYSNLVE